MGSSNNYNVNLRFTADTNDAKRQIQSLQKALQEVAKMPGGANELFDDQKLNRASQAALELQQHLSKAVNVNTGKLDLSRFSTSLKASNQDLSSYCNTLLSVGEIGQDAFLELATAISTADVPLTNVNKKILDLGTSIKNAAKWQISSSIIHGFMGAVQGAYGYAEDLNESLNNIRIVTGQTTAQMDKFAASANKAAKALSATTLDYTNASLIYYQQGLTDQQVKERTDVTIKMANVAQQSATAVSDQMTAIWNNFYDGSKSLEYYADVLVKLGAATASSTDEIAGGLEKFAAIGQTIGLSYEYAASALATITSNTRQSEEVVGTALKTIFARIQDLELGETLEDGTSLGSYAQALKAVGVDVLDTAGQMRKMDDILDDLAAKWDGLSSATKTATAQAVAGTRQYVQLVALMDNWNANDADSMTANLGYTRSATGELDAQAEIYAESWEAARDRVQAALESIYNEMVNDDFFITMLNAAEKALTTLKGFIDGLGGIKGILLTISSIWMRTYAHKMPETLQNLKSTFMSFTGQAKEETVKVQQSMSQIIKGEADDTAMYDLGYSVQLRVIDQVNKMKQQLILKSKDMTEQEKLEAQIRIDNVAAIGQETAALAKQAQAARDTFNATLSRASTNTKTTVASWGDNIKQARKNQQDAEVQFNGTADDADLQMQYDRYFQLGEAVDNYTSKIEDARIALANFSSQDFDLINDEQVADVSEALKSLTNPDISDDAYKESIGKINSFINSLTEELRIAQTEYSKFSAATTGLESQGKQWANSKDTPEELGKKMLAYAQATTEASNRDKAFSAAQEELQEKLGESGISIDEVKKAWNEYALAIQKIGDEKTGNISQKLDILKSILPKLGMDPEEIKAIENSAQSQGEALAQLMAKYENFIGAADKMPEKQVKLSESFTNLASGVMALHSGISMLMSVWDTLSDPDTSGWEKFGAFLSACSTAIFTLIPAYESLINSKIVDGVVNWANEKSEKKVAKAKKETAEASKEASEEQSKETGAQAVDTVVNNVQSGSSDSGSKGIGKTGGSGSKEISKLTSGGAAELGSVLGKLGLIAVAIAIVAATVTLAYNEAHKAEKELEKAEQAASQLKQNYEDVQSIHDEFMSNINTYEEATKNLSELTKGTEEYCAALKEANDAALQLLQSGEDLIYTIQDGQIVIDPDSLEKAQELSSQRVATAQAARLAGQQAQREAEENLEKRNIARNMNSGGTDLGMGAANVSATTVGGIGAGASIGFALGGPVGAGIGALIGAGIGAVGGTIAQATTGVASDKEMDAIAKLAEAYNEDSSIMAKVQDGTFDWSSIKIEDQGLISALSNNADQVIGLAKEMAANTAATNAENDLIAANALANNEKVASSDYRDQVIDIAGDAYGALKNQILESADWTETWGKVGIWQATKVNDEAKKVFSDYLTYAGLDDQNYTLVDTQGNDDNRTFIYEDEEGNTHTVYLEAMQAARAAYEASGQLEGISETLVTTFNNLASSAELADQALLSFLSQKNFEGATDEEFQAFLAATQNEDGEFDESLIKDYLAKGGITDDTTAISFGYDSYQDAIDKTTSAGKKMITAWETYLDNYVQTVQDKVGSLDTSQLSYDEIQALASKMEQAFINSGLEGINTLSEMYSQAAESGFGDEFVDALDNIDWSDITIDELEDYFKSVGINTNYTAGQLANLIQVMDDTSLSVEKACEKFASLVSILKDLDTGDTITAEEYKENFRGKEGAEDLFLSMYDGSYRFIGDKSDLERFKTDSYNDIMNASAMAVEQRQAYSNISSWTAGDIQEVVNGGKIATNTDLINLLKASGYGNNSEQMAKLAEFQSGNTAELQATVNEWITEVGGATATQDAIADTMSDLEETIRTNGEKIASAAGDIGELNSLLEQEKISEEDYNKAIQAIARDEYESYGLDPDVAEQLSKAIEQDIIAANEEWYKSAQNVEDGQERINEGLKDSTVRYARLNDAIEDIYDNYDSYEDVLKQVKAATDNASRAEAANSDNAKKLKKALAGLLDTSEDFIDADLLSAIDPEDFEDAANGDINAIERIRNKFIELEGQMAGLGTEDIQSLQDALNEFNDGAIITVDNTPFLQTLIEAWVKAGLTATEIEDKLSGLGIDADVSAFDESMQHIADSARAAGEFVVDATSISSEAEAEPVDTQVDYQGFEEIVTPDSIDRWAVVPENNFLGARIYPVSMPFFRKTVKQIPVPTTVQTGVASSVTTSNEAGAKGKGGIIIKNMHKSGGNKVSTANTSRPPVSSGSGGSASKPDIKDYTKKSDVVERYKEVNDQLDNVADSMSKVQNVADKLWGKDHIKNLQSQNKLLSQQIALLEEEYEEALAYQKEDAKAVREAAEALGLSAVVSLDEGRITNIESIQEQMYNQLHAAEEYYNGLTSKDEQDRYKETVLEPLEKRIEAFEDAVGLFEESSDTAMDAELKKQEARLEQMANNFTIWTENLDIPIELNEKDVQYIEWLISRLEDDVYEMAEKGALIIGSLSEGQIGGQMEKYLDNLELADASLKDLESSYAAGEITQANYIEGLDKISETYLDNIQNLDELDKAMQELYGETISAATEELAKYTEQMEHSTSVLDHYKSVIELMGKSNDYEMIGKVLEGQAKTVRNQMEVSKQWYEAMRTNADVAAAEYAAAQARGASEAELEILKQNWDEAETAANEAQEQMLSDTEAWAEKMKEVLENKLAGFGQTLENALTGGTSFDTMTGALERASSLQEEYLTTTNQIYETNKLMRQAQQEIDKTTNSVAKKRLAAYINETQQLQNQSKLSSYELEIQQAKYNLLLAEMALQEAQDAKSVVRLQRDSEGNLGYVYTADQDKIADAQQKLEDAQNSLYNIGLEGANGYVEKYSQLMSEMYDTITEIQSQYLEGAFESEEEYQNAIMEAKQYYYDKLKDYSSLYQIALTADSRVVADAWSTDFADMTYNTAQWMDAIEIYVDQAAQAFKDWHNEVTGSDGLVGIGADVDAVAASVESVVDKSDELAEITINTVIPALDDEMDSVQNLTGSYATLRDTIIEIIDKYGLMIDTINGKKRSYWDGGTDEGGSESNANDSESTDTTPSDGTGGNSGNAAAATGLKVGDRVTVKGSVRQFSQKSGNQYMQEWVPGSEFEVFRIDGSQVLIGDRKRSGTYTGWVNRSDLEGFASGGYTGEWGSYGKLAMLHQKELVLNADDTKNFLASMELLDHILEVIDLQSASAQLGGLLTSPGVRDNNSTIEQTVHIEASFPNVQERSEIEEAFNNLINQASQYANRK